MSSSHGNVVLDFGAVESIPLVASMAKADGRHYVLPFGEDGVEGVAI